MTAARQYTNQDPESLIERELLHGVRALGGLCLKFAPVTSGVPDRVVLLPGGRTVFVELKRPGGRLRKIQEVWHRKMRDRDAEVIVLYSRQDVFSWLASVKIKEGTK